MAASWLGGRALVGALVYFVLGCLWIAFSDAWLGWLVPDPAEAARLQTWKGWFYVSVTAVLVWLLLRWASRVRDAERETQRRLREVVDWIPDAILVRDAAGRYELCNREAERLLGLSRAQIQGQMPESFYEAEDAERLRLNDQLAAQSDTPVHRIAGHRPRGADPIQLDIKVIALRDAARQVTGFVSVARDITEARRIEEALRRSETGLRLALESTGDGFWDWDLATDKVEYSDTLQHLLRYDGGQFATDFRFKERLHPEDVDSVMGQMMAALQRGERFFMRGRLLCFDGQYRWFLARGQTSRGPDGIGGRFSGVMTDLTERDAIEAGQRLAATVFDSELQGVLVMDAGGAVLQANRAFCQLLGLAPAEVRGPAALLLKPGTRQAPGQDRLWDVLEQEGRWQGELWVAGGQGQDIPLLCSLSAVRDAMGRRTHWVGVFTDITRLKTSEAELAFLAHHDPLTRLPNRRLFQDRLETALRDCERSGERLAVLLLDLDRFKDVNDSFGHPVGDELLQHVALRLRDRVRAGDTLARLGGDEFALLMQHPQRDEDPARLAQSLIDALAQPWRSSDGVELVVGTSVGICLYPSQGRSSQALLQGADAALYRAKADGRGVYRYFADEMTRAARERLRLEARLRQAMAHGGLSLHYQPQLEVASGRVVGVEALLRWHDPEEGVITPARFIPVAETTGLIVELGRWVLHEACRQARQWLDEGLPPLRVAVNVSPHQFQHGDLAAQVQQALADSGLPADALEIELTEGALMAREHASVQMLECLNGMGVGIAIDDFGTDYSSLAYLKRFPIDVLKIDRGFIAELAERADDLAISEAVIGLGHTLGVRVLAEGVETQAQLDLLRSRGCDLFQGFLASAPLPADQLAPWLRQSATINPLPTDITRRH